MGLIPSAQGWNIILVAQDLISQTASSRPGTPRVRCRVSKVSGHSAHEALSLLDCSPQACITPSLQTHYCSRSRSSSWADSTQCSGGRNTYYSTARALRGPSSAGRRLRLPAEPSRTSRSLPLSSSWPFETLFSRLIGAGKCIYHDAASHFPMNMRPTRFGGCVYVPTQYYGTRTASHGHAYRLHVKNETQRWLPTPWLTRYLQATSQRARQLAANGTQANIGRILRYGDVPCKVRRGSHPSPSRARPPWGWDVFRMVRILGSDTTVVEACCSDSLLHWSASFIA